MSSEPYLTQACAHRGDNHEAPENTVPAFSLALEKGAAQIEFDVRTTRDEQLVVIHDPTVDRTTNGTGAVSDLTFDEIRSLDAGAWKGEAFVGVQIPTLDEVLSLVGPGVEVNCQLYLDPQYTGVVIGRILAHGLKAQTFLACPAAHLHEARRIEPGLRICSLEGQRGADSDYPDITIALGAEYIQICGWSDCLPEVVTRLHAHHVKVNFFGTEDAALMRRLIEARVDYVLTDYLDLMHDVMAEYGLQPAGQRG